MGTSKHNYKRRACLPVIGARVGVGVRVSSHTQPTNQQPFHMEILAWCKCMVCYLVGSVASVTAGDSSSLLSSPSELECGTLGYNSVDLLCSSCEALVQFSLGHHSDECRKCCKDDGDGGLQRQTKYPRAILEICG